MDEAVLATQLPYPKRSGKVRDVYDVSEVVGSPALLIVATDRISAFDCVLPNGIPDKGKVLTRVSNFWFARMASLVDHHLLATRSDDLPEKLRVHASSVEGRFVLARKTKVVPIECVARGYITGSGWREYQSQGTVCGIALPKGLKQCDCLPEPIFTPATKAETGHDQNISFEQASDLVGGDVMTRLRELTLQLYNRAATYAAGKGILIADTKFEFGIDEAGKIVLIDEILTPDSSRFWPASDYEPGHDQASYDKQFVRNWLEAQPWNKQPPAPKLPAEVIVGTRRRYIEAFEKLTGLRW
jgi:phosphoribosylaminoimidazole-succinocarboxamide synthase